MEIVLAGSRKRTVAGRLKLTPPKRVAQAGTRLKPACSKTLCPATPSPSPDLARAMPGEGAVLRVAVGALPAGRERAVLLEVAAALPAARGAAVLPEGAVGALPAGGGRAG